jgi:DNA-binding PadR family transcriptional regulator
MASEIQQETESTRQSVFEDRTFFVQAIIVRIMKSRKEMTHVQLTQEILHLSKSQFAPSIQLIKKCIETLLDKQYIERTDQRDTYRYVA